MTQDARRRAERWETVAVTALPPGWRNVYRMDDGTVHTETCPAMLLQELRSMVEYWDAEVDGQTRLRAREHPEDPPYETTVVFATNEDGWVHKADDTGNYEGTIGPGEEPPS